MRLTIYIDTSFRPSTGEAQAGYIYNYKNVDIMKSSNVFISTRSDHAEIEGIAYVLLSLPEDHLVDIDNILIVNDNYQAVYLYNRGKNWKPSKEMDFPIVKTVKLLYESMNIKLSARHQTRQSLFIKKADKLSKEYRQRGTRSKKV